MNVSQAGEPNVPERPEKPLKSKSDSATATRVQFADVDRPFHTILFVEDEPDVLRGYRKLFATLGFSVLTADCENKALALLRLVPIDAAVVDYPLADTGIERTASRIREANAHLHMVVLAGRHAIPHCLLNVVDASVDKFAGPQALLLGLEAPLEISESM